MGLILQYVVQTKAGSWHYRRRVPTSLKDAVGKSELKRKLGDTRQEALKVYPKVHMEFEAQLKLASLSMTTKPNQQAYTELDVYRKARELVATWAETDFSIAGEKLRGFDKSEDGWGLADILETSIVNDAPTNDDGDIIDGDPVQLRALAMLRSGGKAEPPEPTVLDAKRLYIKERVAGDGDAHRKMLSVERAIGHLTGAGIGDDVKLKALRREDARAVRDRMLHDLQMKPTTVRRAMNDIRAIINFGFTEFDVRDATNPFHNLEIKSSITSRDERLPIPKPLLAAIRLRLADHANATLWQIWKLLEATGCRLAEVVGLLVSDVHLDCPVPHINLVHHEHRRLKNNSSVRRVPLVGEGLEVALELLQSKPEGKYLFPRYTVGRGSDRVSAALMKHLRTITDNPKYTVHSLRHSMEDRLLLSGVEEFDRNLVLGHTSGGMGERYGGPDARLEAAHRALSAALKCRDPNIAKTDGVTQGQ